jgi:hypothetical protein
MTAPIGTSLNVYSGLRELSNVTNTYGGYLISGGIAYDLVLPWQADKFEWFNYTKYGTDTNNLQGVWFRDFPAGDALIINRGTTTLTSTLETTNGVTINNLAGGFTDEHLVISGLTTATPAVVTTTTSHNLSNNDRVIITKVIGTVAPEVNNTVFVVQVLSATTFSLYDTFGVPITTIGSYTSSGQVTKIGPLLGDVTRPTNPAIPHNGIINYPIQYQLHLGTSVMGADGDVIYFQATQFNAYFNLGDIG